MISLLIFYLSWDSPPDYAPSLCIHEWKAPLRMVLLPFMVFCIPFLLLCMHRYFSTSRYSALRIRCLSLISPLRVSSNTCSMPRYYPLSYNSLFSALIYPLWLSGISPWAVLTHIVKYWVGFLSLADALVFPTPLLYGPLPQLLFLGRHLRAVSHLVSQKIHQLVFIPCSMLPVRLGAGVAS